MRLTRVYLLKGKMRLQKQPNRWSCWPTAFAMVADVPVEKFFETIRSNGSQIIFPELPEPLNRRSFAFNELLACMVEFGYSCTPIITEFEQGPKDTDCSMVYMLLPGTIERYMQDYDGVITGFLPSGAGHAVAWNHEEKLIYDPRGTVEELSALRLKMETFFLCSELKRPPLSSPTSS